MGSKVFDFLSESFLFDDSLIDEPFRGVSEDEKFIDTCSIAKE